MAHLTVIHNCRQLVTCRSNAGKPLTSDGMSDLTIIPSAAIVIKDDRIVWVGAEADLPADYRDGERVDADGGVITAGLVDPHTHPVFAATREDEFYMRNAGKSYMEIAEVGGGIRNSARKTQQADKQTLYRNGMHFLDYMLKSGTTSAEAKSGYGLTTESEIKSLEVIADLNRDHAIDLVPTFLGAHEFPDQYRENREEYVRILIEEMIPQVAQRKLAKYCDIFTEAGVFDIVQSRRIMSAAKEHGFRLKFHADELKSIGGAELAAELGAISADHLVYISDEGIDRMAEAGTIAVLLPATTFFLGHKEYAPARKMIEQGVPVSIATDFNPGSACTTSLPVTMTIAAIYLRMTASEILTAVTYNSACAIGLGEQVGTLEPEKLADLVIWDVSDFSQIPYLFAHNPVKAVYKRGQQVV